MYLISQILKGNQFYCQVFYVNNLKTQPVDVTDQVAKKFNYRIKENSIQISFWSGTWINRIRQNLTESDSKINVYDVSVFKS